MPPPSNQGSRGALVTWTVVTSIASVAALVMAFVFYAGKSRAELELEKVSRQGSAFLGRSIDNPTQRGLLTEARTAMGLGNDTPLLNVAIAQRDALSNLVGAGTPAASMASAQELMNGLTENGQPVTTLTGAMKALNAKVAAAEAGLKKATDDLAAERTKSKLAADQAAAAAKAAQDAVLASAAAQKKAEDQLAAITQTKDKDLQSLGESNATSTNTFNEQLRRANEQVGQLQNQLAAKEAENKQLQQKLGQIRVPTQQVARQADGNIISTPGNDIVFINLGQGDQITPGMTFEVYDRISGVPAPGTDERDDPQPKGKAAIEIIRVQQGSSEARVVRKGAQPITEGDLIANLVYDKNTRYNFVVHGNFDLDRNGVPTPNDAEVVKRLVTQWGGQVQSDLSVNTDFLVLGAEPKQPEYSEADVANDPLLAARRQQAEQELNDYLALREKAIQYNIPILNQNRFLYLTGYYQTAGR
jgi:hypothetical protein